MLFGQHRLPSHTSAYISTQLVLIFLHLLQSAEFHHLLPDINLDDLCILLQRGKLTSTVICIVSLVFPCGNGDSMFCGQAGAAGVIAAGHDCWGSMLFCLSLNHKQMSMYYAPAFFAHLLGKCLQKPSMTQQVHTDS